MKTKRGQRWSRWSLEYVKHTRNVRTVLDTIGTERVEYPLSGVQTLLGAKRKANRLWRNIQAWTKADGQSVEFPGIFRKFYRGRQFVRTRPMPWTPR